MPDHLPLFLEYTRNFRANTFGHPDDDEPESAVGYNLCSTCFRFVTTSAFGIIDGTKSISIHLQKGEERDVHRLNDDDNATSLVRPEQSQYESEPQNSTTAVPLIDAPSTSGAWKSQPWSLRECFITSSYCSICQHITETYHSWQSAEYGGKGLKDCKIEDVRISSDYGCPYSSRYERSGEDQIDDFSNLELMTPAVSMLAPVPVSPYEGVFGPRLLFQCIEGLHCTVEEFIKSREEPLVQDFGDYCGRLRPQDLHFPLLKFWMTHCLERHGDACSADLASQPPIDRIRLIDVKSRRLVDRTGSEDYFALSYVWGAGNTTLLLRSNITRYYQSHSLTQLPATIADAITVTEQLGAEYVWVDSLCIVQDDDQDKAQFLSVMDIIYGHAKLTIISAAGTGAQDGLPGVHPNTRSAMQVPFKSHSSYMIVRSLMLQEGGSNYVRDSIWYSRAWTLQERIYSKRVLIFTREQVYWECQTATWREDATWESIDPPLFRDDGVLEEADFYRIIEQGRDDSVTFEDAFRRLVQHYSKRKISVLSDNLHAFYGILKLLSYVFEEPFHWGLPVRYFVDALCWPAMPDDGALKCTRIEQHHLLPDLVAGSSLRVPLPSWSWSGWKCYLPWKECGYTLVEENDVGLRVFAITRSGEVKEITSFNKDCSSQGLSEHDKRARVVEERDIANWLFSDPRRHIAIHFWTDVATVEVLSEEIAEEGDLTRVTILRQDSIRIQVQRQTHSIDLDSTHSKMVSAVLITKHTRHYQKGANWLQIMLVTWQDDIAYKLAMVEILESDWLGLTGKLWRVISLC